jgi:DNA polymerase III delta subunit
VIITLHGPDSYRRAEKRRALVAEFEKKHGPIGIAYFDLEEDGAEDSLLGFLAAQSMFSPAKLAVVAHPFAETGKPYIAALKAAADDASTAILLDAEDKPTKAFAFVLPKAKSVKLIVQDFAWLADPAWSAFVKLKAKECGVVLAEPAMKLLAQAYAKDTWGLVTELEKLALLGRPVAAADVAALALELAPNFWEMVGGLKHATVGRRLHTFERLLSLGEPAAKIFNIIAYQWPEKLPLLAAYDLAVKSGRFEYEEAMTDALLA